MGSPIDMHPHQVILTAMQMSLGEALYCDEQVRRLAEDELFERPAKTSWVTLPSGQIQEITEVRSDEQVSRWVKWRDESLDRAAKYAKMAIDVGVDERAILLAERQADQVDKFLRAVVDELDLSPTQYKKLGPAMRRQFNLINQEVPVG